MNLLPAFLILRKTNRATCARDSGNCGRRQRHVHTARRRTLPPSPPEISRTPSYPKLPHNPEAQITAPQSLSHAPRRQRVPAVLQAPSQTSVATGFRKDQVPALLKPCQRQVQRPRHGTNCQEDFNQVSHD